MISIYRAVQQQIKHHPCISFKHLRIHAENWHNWLGFYLNSLRSALRLARHFAAGTHAHSAHPTPGCFCSCPSPRGNHTTVADTMQGPEQIRAEETPGKLSQADSYVSVAMCLLVSSKPAENEHAPTFMHLAFFKTEIKRPERPTNFMWKKNITELLYQRRTASSYFIPKIVMIWFHDILRNPGQHAGNPRIKSAEACSVLHQPTWQPASACTSTCTPLCRGSQGPLPFVPKFPSVLQNIVFWNTECTLTST